MADFQNPVLEIDDATTMDDDGYSSCNGSETQSISSSINQYMEQNGRRYHAYFGPNKNPMPSDQIEQERLDIVHEITLLLLRNRTHLAPLAEHHHRVLDLGTGTGIWATDFADANPHTEVLGVDITPIQPGWVPPNCRFEIDDFEQGWNFKRPFDFIHARAIAQSVDDWPRLLEQVKSQLSPGGWFELAEWCFEPKCDDGTMPSDWPPVIAFGHVRRGLRQLGRLCPEGSSVKQLLEQAGFEDVCQRTIKLPMGSWAKDPVLKEAGNLFTLGASSGGYEAHLLHLGTTVLGMTAEEVLKICNKGAASHLVPRHTVHAYMELYIAYGRKPVESI